MRPLIPVIGFLATSVMLPLVGKPVSADDELRKLQREFTTQIKPLIQRACGDCHSGEKPDAGLRLDQYETLDQLLRDRKKLKKAEVRVIAREMPPDDAEPLDDVQYEQLIDWLDRLLNSADCSDINPGQVTIRRLNRTEYQNTIRDLIGVDYQPAADFPGDDVGYGFDNVADVISLPPILMEKYLEAAEQITRQALVDPDRPAFQAKASASQFRTSEGARATTESVVLYSNSKIVFPFEIQQAGNYEIDVEAFGQMGGDDPPKMEVEISGQSIGKRSIRWTRSDSRVTGFKWRGIPGEYHLEISFTNDAYKRDEYDRNLHVVGAEIRGPTDYLPESHRQIVFRDVPDDRKQQDELARSILNRLASRAFRRRATSDELDQLMEFYQQARSDGDVFEVALRLPIQAMLVSPHFLFRVETPVAVDQARMLNDFELATSLSYFLWSTMPDDELFGLASAGKLRNIQTYRQQIRRMLADPRSQALVENFVAQWLQLRHLEDFEPDPELFPGIDRAMREDMIQETKLVMAELIRNDASLMDLLKTDFTYVNQRLGKLYGIEIGGDQFQRVSTRSSGRVGLMTHASILTLTSNPTRTSPVKRGKWIMENLLGEEPPPPDPDAMELDAQTELTGSLRQRMEQHRADPNCASCHQVMDELGFALEHFDAVGRWREDDLGEPIDDLGELPDGTRFEGPQQLQDVISNKLRKQFARCLSEKMLIYATGRGIEYFDECAIEKIMEALEKNDYKFSELIYQVAISDPFLKRRGQIESDED